MAVLVLVADSNRLESLEPLVPEILQALKTLHPKSSFACVRNDHK
jgi:hypothetical protein